MRTKTKLISGLLIALLFLTACAQLPQPSDPAAETTRAPGPALFEADYALLWEILESDYPYLPYLREKGVDIEGLREKYLQQAVEAAEEAAAEKVADAEAIPLCIDNFAICIFSDSTIVI